jgi:hypothetical protein
MANKADLLGVYVEKGEEEPTHALVITGVEEGNKVSFFDTSCANDKNSLPHARNSWK